MLLSVFVEQAGRRPQLLLQEPQHCCPQRPGWFVPSCWFSVEGHSSLLPIISTLAFVLFFFFFLFGICSQVVWTLWY